MKRKVFYGTLICVAIVVSVFYACKKENESTPKLSSGGAVSSNTGARFVGEKVYYSKNRAGNTIYKMVLTGDVNGIMNVDRRIYSTTRPDTFEVYIGIDQSVPYTSVYNQGGTTIDYLSVGFPPAGKKYFYIPFAPASDTLCFRPDGYPPLVYDCVPMGTCPVNADCIVMPDIFGEKFFCWGCEDCWLVVELPQGFPGTKVLPNNSGSLLIEASGLQITN